MSLIPLTSQWLEQLSVTATSLSSVLQGQLAPLQPLIDRLAVFASAHKSTAEELQAAGAAQALVGALFWGQGCGEPAGTGSAYSSNQPYAGLKVEAILLAL